MPFRFNQLLEEAQVAPAGVRLLRHQTLLVGGRTPAELWQADRALFDDYQRYQLVDQRAYFAGQHWASFVGLRDGRTMFAGLYAVAGRALAEKEFVLEATGQLCPAGSHDRYEITLQPELSGYAGRLFIDWGGGPSGKRAWKQRADAQDKLVVELQPEAAPAPFPGLMNVVAPLSRIATAPASWMAALSAARGIYLLTCPRTGEAYVGSATGEGGFWSRWQEYCLNGHGGNAAMRQRERSDYTASVLEVAGSADTRDDILAMESIWKRKLETRRTGLTRN